MRAALSAVVTSLTLTVAARADEAFPKPGWQDLPNPQASPHAVVGGELRIHAHQYPKSFNYYLDSNAFSAELFGAMYETLLSMNPLTLEYEPALASAWTISDDKRTFTFRIATNAAWSDGKPVTAEDVRWTFDAIMNPTNLTGPHKVALQVFDSPQVLGEREIRFAAREVHWRNLGAVGGFQILPRHAWATQDFNKVNFSFPVVSGPYRLGEVREGLSAALVRRPDWWNRRAPSARGTANFQTLKFRFYAEQENAYEAFKKGDMDLFAVYMARLWVNETSGERFDKHWIVKQKVLNYRPVGFQGFAMNLRRAPFNDLRVRRALALLLHRERMNSTIMYNQYFLHRSYFEDLYDQDHPCPNALVPFAPDRARALLAEAGWKANPQTGLLEKDGQPFVFRFLTRDTSSEKFLSIYAEDLKNVGITLKIDQKDWAAWSKDMDEFNYDMTWAAWSAGLFKDPEGMWASQEADRTGGINITGYKNPKVDELIERQKTMFDVAARHAIVREIDALLCADAPYILLWNINYTRLLYWNRFGTPPQVLSKYGDEGSSYWYWWFDEDSAADLQRAMEAGQPLPAPKPDVRFDADFKPVQLPLAQ
jgi:microcin C transport system substrate-binding protein